MELIIVGIVLFAAVMLYVLERKSRGKEIELVDAGKIGVAASALTGGILFALGGETAVPEVAKEAVEVAQEMFVGKPSF